MDTITIKQQIKDILDTCGRLRAATLSRKFTSGQQSVILSWPSDEEFKVKALRTAGYGTCKVCSKSTNYVEKMRFYEFCSKECEISNKRNAKGNFLEQELNEFGLKLTNPSTKFVSVDQEINCECTMGHFFSATIKSIRYRNKGCPICQADKRKSVKLQKSEQLKQTLANSRKQIAIEKRLHTKELTCDKRNSLAGTKSEIQCKHCGQLTLYRLVKIGYMLQNSAMKIVSLLFQKMDFLLDLTD